jgi:hypothetical protein
MVPGGDAAALLGFALAWFVFFVSVFSPLDLCFFVFRFHYCGGSSFSSLSSIVWFWFFVLFLLGF